MTGLHCRREIGPIARLGKRDRRSLSRQLGIAERSRWILLAMGGLDFRLPVERWHSVTGVN